MTATQASRAVVRPPGSVPLLKAACAWAARGMASFGLAVAALSLQAPAALADNCSGLSDCFYTLAAALLIAALLALLIAFLLGTGGGGGLVLAGFGTMTEAAVAASWANAAAAAAAAAATAAAAGQILEMSSQGTPGNNQAQNRQFRDAVREAERDLGRKFNKDEIRRIHDEITGQNMGYHEIVEVIKGMFGG